MLPSAMGLSIWASTYHMHVKDLGTLKRRRDPLPTNPPKLGARGTTRWHTRKYHVHGAVPVWRENESVDIVTKGLERRVRSLCRLGGRCVRMSACQRAAHGCTMSPSSRRIRARSASNRRRYAAARGWRLF